MWWVGSSRLARAADVYLGTRWASWATGGRSDVFEAVSPEQGLQWAFDSLSAGQDKSSRGCRVWLSGALAKPFVFQSIEGLNSRREAMKVADRLASEVLGAECDGAVWLDNWRPGRTCLGIAAAKALRDAVEHAAKASRLKVQKIAPWWIAAHNALAAESNDVTALLIDEPDAATLLGFAGVQIRLAESWAPRPDPAEALALIKQAMVGGELAAAGLYKVTLDTASVCDPPAWTAAAMAARRELVS